MTKFIKLHHWQGYRVMPTHNHGEIIYVNIDLVTEIRAQKLRVTTDNAVQVTARPIEDCTSLSYAAGSGEEIDGCTVCETPEEIFRIMNGA